MEVFKPGEAGAGGGHVHSNDSWAETYPGTLLQMSSLTQVSLEITCKMCIKSFTNAS